MVPEKRFTDKEKNALAAMRLSFEMAHPNEWIIRDEERPDDLLRCYVAPTGDGEELQCACSCLDGSADRPCPHALGVFGQVRSDERIMVQLFRRKPSSGEPPLSTAFDDWKKTGRCATTDSKVNPAHFKH